MIKKLISALLTGISFGLISCDSSEQEFFVLDSIQSSTYPTLPIVSRLRQEGDLRSLELSFYTPVPYYRRDHKFDKMQFSEIINCSKKSYEVPKIEFFFENKKFDEIDTPSISSKPQPGTTADQAIRLACDPKFAEIHRSKNNLKNVLYSYKKLTPSRT